jgi:hypothetical protein
VPGGVVDEQFDGDKELADVTRVHAALLKLGPHIGLDAETVSYLLSVIPTFGSDYPYTYKPYDEVLSSDLKFPHKRGDGERGGAGQHIRAGTTTTGGGNPLKKKQERRTSKQALAERGGGQGDRNPHPARRRRPARARQHAGGGSVGHRSSCCH